MEERETLLEITAVSKSYNGKAKALDGVSLTVRRGEFVSVIGSSGAGKSTLLRCVNRLIDPSGGSIRFDGHEVTRLNGRALRQLRRRISMVFQHYNLVYRSTAIENVLQGRLGYKSALAGAFGAYTEAEKEQAFDMLAQLGLAEFAYRRCDQLSGGQKQRVGIARALVQDPLLILADEPIASLDPKSSRTIMEHLRWAADDLGIACLVNLHQVDYALEFSDRIVGLKAGRVVFDGAPDELDAKTISAIYGTPLATEHAASVEASLGALGSLEGFSDAVEADVQAMADANDPAAALKAAEMVTAAEAIEVVEAAEEPEPALAGAGAPAKGGSR